MVFHKKEIPTTAAYADVDSLPVETDEHLQNTYSTSL